MSDPNADRMAEEPKEDPGPTAPARVDPLSILEAPSAFTDCFRIEASQMSVKIVFGEFTCGKTKIVPKAVVVMPLNDFQRFVSSLTGVMLSYRTNAKDKPQ